jgi:Kef-type K+ transport system membrane component KefB
MTQSIIITICLILLLAYVFDLSASKTRIPSVISFLMLGWLLQQAASLLQVKLPDFNFLLPVLGTIGLILIVLEGSLELHIDRSRVPMIRKSLILSVLPLLFFTFALAGYLVYYQGVDWKRAMLNAVPFSIISSAIAIPSASGFSKSLKEFVIYESSLSDIFGVIVFNFLAYNTVINAQAFGRFGLEFLLILLVSVVAITLLSLMMSRVKHHIKFVPILLLSILVYSLLKEFHLPSLIFILLFGLFLGNLEAFGKLPLMKRFSFRQLNAALPSFHEISTELAFVIRALFFILFGFLLKTEEIINLQTLPLAASIVGLVLLLRIISLRVLSLPVLPLLFVAPRGLITILLFLSIPIADQIPAINSGVVIQTVLLSALLMMLGLIFTNGKKAV